MKKIIFNFTTLLAATVIFTGCLKDKGFDNQEYGIKDPAGGPIGISIPEASQDLTNLDIKLVGVEAVTTSQVVNLFDLNLESEKPAPADISINLVLKPTLVADYNSQNAANYQLLPTTAYTINNLKVTIKAGERTAGLKITIPNALALGTTTKYALAFGIASVDQAGYTIATNLSNIVCAINVKNDWDGRYRVASSRVTDPNRPTISSAVFGISPALLVDLITTGPNSNKMEWPNFNPPITGHAAPTTAGGWTFFGNAQPDYVWNAATDNVTSVNNALFGPPQNRTYQLVAGAGSPNRRITSGATKTITVIYDMLQAGFLPVRHWDSLVYIGPRP